MHRWHAQPGCAPHTARTYAEAGFGFRVGLDSERRNDGETTASIHISVGTDDVTLSYQQCWRGGEWQNCTNVVMLIWTEFNLGANAHGGFPLMRAPNIHFLQRHG